MFFEVCRSCVFISCTLNPENAFEIGIRASALPARRAVSGAREAAAPGADVRDDPLYRLKADLFRALGHPTRIRMLELLRDGERSVGELQEALGLDSSGVSQHLTALRRQGLLVTRRTGTSVRCAIKDPRVLTLLAAGRELLVANLTDSSALLSELDAEVDARDQADRGRA